MEVRKGYKQTEVGVIPSDWEVKPLKDISSLKGRIGWQGLKQTEFTMNADEPFLITGMNFKDGEIRWNEVYHISLERYEIAKEIQLKIDDVLITKDGTIGKLLFISKIPYPGKASLNSHLLVFRPVRNSYMPKFLYYQLASKKFRDYIELNKSGSTFFGISQEAVGGYKAILPPLPEQTAIADALSDADALITSLEKLIAKKRNIKQGAMQELLTGKKRLPGFSGEWEVKKLGEIGYFKGGSGFPTKYQGAVEGEFPFFKVSDMNNEGNSIFMINSHNWISESVRKTIGATVFPIGSIVFAKIGAAIFLERKKVLHQDSCIDNNMMGFVLDEAKADCAFVHFWFLNIKLGKLVSITALPSLNGREIGELEFQLPKLEEQTAIAQILSDMDADEIEALEHKLAKYRMIKQGMMQELLTGRTRLV